MSKYVLDEIYIKLFFNVTLGQQKYILGEKDRTILKTPLILGPAEGLGGFKPTAIPITISW